MIPVVNPTTDSQRSQLELDREVKSVAHGQEQAEGQQTVNVTELQDLIFVSSSQLDY